MRNKNNVIKTKTNNILYNVFTDNNKEIKTTTICIRLHNKARQFQINSLKTKNSRIIMDEQTSGIASAVHNSAVSFFVFNGFLSLRCLISLFGAGA